MAFGLSAASIAALAIGAASAAAGGIASAVSSMSAADRQKAANDKSFQEWMKVNIPDPKDQQLALQQFVSQGKLAPQLESAIKQDPSGLSQVVTSMSQKQAQNNALQSMQQIGESGGLRLQDKAALQDAQMQSDIKGRADREAITSDMARRGQEGSGFDLASQLQAQQGQSDQNAQTSLKVASGAQDRALQSIMQAGQLGTQMRSQDFSEQADKAKAQDAINQFNTTNLQNVQARNVASQNAAQSQNLKSAQDLSNQNTALANQQQQYNKELIQKQFQNQAAIAGAKSNINAQEGAIDQQQGQAMSNAFSNIGSGLGKAGGSLAQGAYWDDYFAKQKQNQTPPAGA